MADIVQEFPSIAPRDAKITLMKPGDISRDGTDLALILTVSIILYSLFAAMLQRGLLQKLYGEIYQALEEALPKGNERQRVSFIYHHIAAISFAAILLIGGYPAVSFTCGSGTLSTPVGSRATIGDMLSILLQVYCGYYLFEITFRSKYISLIALAHHIGLLIIGQTAAFLGSHASRGEEGAEGTKEFYLCIVWGTSYINEALCITALRSLTHPYHMLTMLHRRIRFSDGTSNAHHLDFLAHQAGQQSTLLQDRMYLRRLGDCHGFGRDNCYRLAFESVVGGMAIEMADYYTHSFYSVGLHTALWCYYILAHGKATAQFVS
jgi:hypothetical protein